MPIEILMPALSPTMTHGDLLSWHKAIGDVVKAGDLLAEIETDKATMEVEAVEEGVLGQIIIPAGTQNVAVNSVLGLLLEEGEAVPPTSDRQSAVPPISPPDIAGQRIIASPLARRIAKTHDLTLKDIKGSGPRGRIIHRDVQATLTQEKIAPPATSSAKPAQTVTFEETPHQITPLTGMRKTIAARLTQSKQTVPHFYLTTSCDMTEAAQARQLLNQEGTVRISFNDMVIRACALALCRVPQANAAWGEQAITYYQRADIAVAVAIEGGLITPIVRAAETKGLGVISQEVKELVLKAKSGQLKPHEFQGGTFSVSNLGMYAIETFCAIINPPQACILAIGSIEPRAVIRNGSAVARQMMTVTLSADHRVVDGAVGAQFLKTFKDLMENPIKMIL